MQFFRVEFQHFFFFFLVSGKKSFLPVHRKPTKVNIRLATCAKYVIFMLRIRRGMLLQRYNTKTFIRVGLEIVETKFYSFSVLLPQNFFLLNNNIPRTKINLHLYYIQILMIKNPSTKRTGKENKDTKS